MPAPPARASSAKTIRTSVTSTPRDSAIPPQTPASARSEVLAANAGRGIAGSWYGAVDAHGPRADTRVQHEHPPTRLVQLTFDGPAVGLRAEDPHGARLHPCAHLERDVGGDGHHKVAD